MGVILSFTARGHENIRALHRNTFEFTKDSHVTPAGDCIIGVLSDFDEPKKLSGPVVIEMEAGGERETVKGELNPDFNSSHEIVVRKSSFLSPRTLCVRADKSCKDLSKVFRDMLKDPQTIIKVRIIEA